MKESLNQVDITGIVSEINIRDIDKGDKKYIAGDVVVKVEENGEISNIPVSFISADTKKDGTPNKIYQSLQQLKTFNSIASAGEENATKVQIRGAKINENLFMPQNGTEVVSTSRISSNFFTKVNGTNFKPESKFRAIIKVLQVADEEVNKDGDLTPTGRLIVKGALVGYADKVDVIKFVVEDETAINFIKINYKEGDTVQIGGRIRYTEEEYVQEQEVGFGEADTRTFTRRKREFLIQRGSAEPLDEESAFSDDDIKTALADRKERMEKVKQAAQQPKPQAAASTNDFGF